MDAGVHERAVLHQIARIIGVAALRLDHGVAFARSGDERRGQGLRLVERKLLRACVRIGQPHVQRERDALLRGDLVHKADTRPA